MEPIPFPNVLKSGRQYSRSLARNSRIASASVLVAFGTFAFAIDVASASDRVLNNDALSAALDVYVDGVIAERAVELACNDPGRDQWTEGNRQLVATLWANGLPDKLVRDVEHRLAAQPATGGPKPDCNDPEVTAFTGQIATNGWPKFHKRMFEGMGLNAVTTASTDALAEVKAVFEREGPAEARMLACIAVTQGVLFPVALSDWTTTVTDASKTMALAGLPGDEVAKLVDSVDPTKIWTKVTGTEANALKKSCAADTTWSDRLNRYETAALRFDVEKILKPAP